MRSCSRDLRVLLVTAAVGLLSDPATAQPASGGDEKAAQKKPEVAPWFCRRCLKQGRIKGERRNVVIHGTPAAELAEKMKLGRRWTAIESPNFRIFCTLKGARVSTKGIGFADRDLAALSAVFPEAKWSGGSANLNAHQRAHMYHVRLEEFCKRFRELTGNEAPHLGMDEPFQVVLFETADQFKRYVTEHMNQNPGKNRFARLHKKGGGNYFLFATTAKHFSGKDRELHNVVTHAVAHMFVNGLDGFYKDVEAWLEEGCAHYFERQLTEKHNSFCVGNRAQPPMFVRGNWRKKIKHTVSRNKAPSFARWCGKLQPHELSDLEHALSWSFVDWLVTTDRVRFGKLLNLASDGEKKLTAAQAIEEVYGVSPQQLHERWRKYVLSTYR